MKNLYKLKERPEETGKPAPALVAAGCRFTGEIRTEADVVVEGELSGKIQVGGRLIIRPGGTTRSDQAECRNAEIYGLFEGTLKVTEHLTIHEKGRVYGDIQVSHISIETGGYFDGNCVTFTEKSSASGNEPAERPSAGTGMPDPDPEKDKKIKK